MSFSYRILLSGHHVQVVGRGAVTTTDCIDILMRVLGDPRTRPDSTALIDLRSADYMTADESEIIAIAKAMEQRSRKLQNNIALVAKRSMLLLAELLAARVRSVARIPMRVFVDLKAAQAFCRENGTAVNRSIRRVRRSAAGGRKP
jgi:hypothetical protein